MAEIVPVVSEALEAQVRNLLPSQRGFGEDLQASNVITPIIDLTRTAEGSTVGVELQQAINFAGSTVVNVTSGTSAAVANSPGFYRLTLNIQLDPNSTSGTNAIISMSDGLSTKNVLRFATATSTDDIQSFFIDEIFFVGVGITLTCTAQTESSLIGSIRQVADAQGNLVYPVGFTPQ